MPQYGEVKSREEQVTREANVPLPGGEDYLAKIAEITEITEPNFSGTPTDFLKVRFEIETFADGAPLEDTDGNPVEEARWIWKNIDPTKFGFMTNGTPSIARQFVGAAKGISGLDLEDRLPAWSTEELIEKYVVLTLVVYKSTRDQQQKNKIVGIKAIGRRGRATAKPAVDPAFTAAAAALVE